MSIPSITILPSHIKICIQIIACTNKGQSQTQAMNNTLRVEELLVDTNNSSHTVNLVRTIKIPPVQQSHVILTTLLLSF